MAEATAPNPSTDTPAPEVRIEDTGPAAKRLTITVSPEAVSEKLEGTIGTLINETALPGFRKGRAPRALVERRFGDALRTETRNQLVAEAYARAIEDQGLQPVGDPRPVEKVEDLELAPGKPLTFSVDVEVVPDFDLPKWEGLAIDKPMLEITDEHVANELELYRRRLGMAERIAGDFRAEDRLVGHAAASRKGEDEPFFTNDRVLVVHPGDEDGGRGQVLGLLVDDLAERLGKVSVGDTMKIEVTAPEGHEREDIRGKDLVIEYEIRDAERVEPASIEEVVATLGFGSEEILREQIQTALTQRRDEEQAGAMRQQAADALVEMVDMALPERLSEQQATRSLERARMEMLYRGLPAEQVENRLAELRTDSAESTQRRLKLFFLLRRLAEEFSVEVTQQEVNGRVAQIAARRGARPEAMLKELHQSGQLAEIANQIREHKALDRVVAKATINEMSAEEWRARHESGGGTATKKKTTKKKSSSTASKKKTTTKKKKTGSRSG